jgi:hypothetical protein
LDMSTPNPVGRFGRGLCLGWLAALALLFVQTASHEIRRVSEGGRQRTPSRPGASHQAKTRVGYFLGNDPSLWRIGSLRIASIC